MASQNGHHDVVQSLLGAGAEVNIATSDVSDVTCVHRVYIVVRTEGKHNMGYGCVCVLAGLEITFSLVLSKCQYNARFVLSSLHFDLSIPPVPIQNAYACLSPQGL